MNLTYSGRERCEEVAAFIIDNKATVRKAAAKFGISKSTVHKDVTAVLYGVNRAMYYSVRSVLELNKAERHLRGGEATKRKYQQKAESRNQKANR